jgi:hypothetical protein
MTCKGKLSVVRGFAEPELWLQPWPGPLAAPVLHVYLS